jgi:aminopeptidase
MGIRLLNEKELNGLARLIARNMRIARKPNSEAVAKAKKLAPWIERFLKKYEGKTVDPLKVKGFKFNQETVKKLSDPEVGLLRKRSSKYLVCSSIGEAVRLIYHPENYAFAKAIAREVMARGAHAMLVPSESATSVDAYNIPSVEAIEELTPTQLALLRNIDVSIRIEGEDDPEWKSRVPSRRLQADRDARMRLYDILDERRIRWLLVGWPFPKVARHYRVSFNWFSDMLFGSLKASFSRESIGLTKHYHKSLNGAEKVQVLHEDGTNLRFSIRGRKILVDDGAIDEEDLARGDVGLNLPSGEVFCSPLENSAEGRIFFKKIYVHGYGFVENLWLEFKRGAVAGYEAGKGKSLFEKFLKENTPSTKTIAELGIGCNPRARYCGYILTDEKIAGTIHIAIGNNTGAYGGRNKASAHLDMVKDMIRGQLVVDGKNVMRDGKPA